MIFARCRRCHRLKACWFDKHGYYRLRTHSPVSTVEAHQEMNRVPVDKRPALVYTPCQGSHSRGDVLFSLTISGLQRISQDHQPQTSGQA